METDVVDLVEDAVTSVEGVKEISSSSRQGAGNITVEFELERDIDVALQDVQTKLSQLQRRLPRGIDPPIVSKTNPEDEPIMRIAIGGSRPPTFVADYIRNVVRPQIQTIPGVGEIQLSGLPRPQRAGVVRRGRASRPRASPSGREPRDPERAPRGAGRPDRGRGARDERPGRGRGDRRRGLPEPRGHLPERRPGAALPTWRWSRTGSRTAAAWPATNGQPAIGFGITKLRGANAVQVGRDVRARLAEIEKQLPEGLFLAVNFDTTVFIERAINEILFTLILAALLTSVVCWVFLGSWSTTLNVLLAIPTSILGTFIVMYVFGFTLNTYTVLGLTLVVGIVVDDAIMVLENIYRHREQGAGKVTAASVGAREITFAAAAATLAIMAIFLPVAFMKGIIGKFFFQFGVTITVAVLISLLEALTLAPMRLSRMLEVGERAGRLERWVSTTFARLAAGYQRLLVPALRHRKLVLAGSALLFVLSLGIVGLLRQEFIPSQDMSRFGIRFQTPVGSSLDTSERILSQIERFLQSRPEVDMFGGFVGGFGGGEVNSGFLFVTMKDPADRPVDPKTGRRLSQKELMAVARQATSAFPGARIVMQDFSQRGFSAGRGGGFPVEFNIRGRDWDELGRSSRVIMEKMRESGLVTDINSDYQVGMPEVQVIPDRNKAADLGISMADIGDTVNSAIGGARIGKFKDKGRRFDIRVRLLGAAAPAAGGHPAAARPHRAAGGLVRLGDVVRIEQRPDAADDHPPRPRARDHADRERRPRGVAGRSRSTARCSSRGEVLPDGYRVVASGSARTFRESFESLFFAMILGLIVAYMVLASQFNAFTHPFTVLLALPFSISGALVALYLAGQSLNVYSFLGLILLMGIAKKNSILLVDFTNQARASGMERHEALLHACPVRLRPILMTSIATIAGALPPALAIGPGAELQRPMALAIVGGMIVSTALTLFVVPAAYSLLDDMVEWNAARKRRGEGLVAALRAARASS